MESTPTPHLPPQYPAPLTLITNTLHLPPYPTLLSPPYYTHRSLTPLPSLLLHTLLYHPVTTFSIPHLHQSNTPHLLLLPPHHYYTPPYPPLTHLHLFYTTPFTPSITLLPHHLHHVPSVLLHAHNPSNPF